MFLCLHTCCESVWITSNTGSFFSPKSRNAKALVRASLSKMRISLSSELKQFSHFLDTAEGCGGCEDTAHSTLKVIYNKGPVETFPNVAMAPHRPLSNAASFES